MLRSDLCDFSDADIVLKGDVTPTKTDGRGFVDMRNGLHHLLIAYQRSIMY